MGLDLEPLIDKIIADGEANSASSSDYINEDGLKYCSMCNTPKQAFVNILGENRRVPIQCKCRIEAKEAEDKKYKILENESRREECFRSSGFKDCSFREDAGFHTEESNRLMKYSSNFSTIRNEPKNSIVLYGTVGTGKSFLASCVANAIIDQGFRVKMTTMTKISDDISMDFNRKRDYLDRLNTYHLLIIDDLRSERKTEYLNELVYEVINSRYEDRRPLIITTNMTREELLKPTDDISRAVSRLYECAVFMPIEGKDNRVLKAKEFKPSF